jgi:hypothetical protein
MREEKDGEQTQRDTKNFKFMIESDTMIWL